MLAKNILRINGRDDNDKRTHIDVEVRMCTQFSIKGEVLAPFIPHPDDIWQMGLDKGLSAVTSFNYWNEVAEKRLTERIW